MFILIARYKVAEKFQKQFIKESNQYYKDKFKAAKGFKTIKFLHNILEPEFIDVQTEWTSKQDFWNFINQHQQRGVIKFSVPVLTKERFLYETME